MKIMSAVQKAQEHGLYKTMQHIKTIIPTAADKCTRILLLTNCDSDNVGDQVIEACAAGLLKAAMKNLNKTCLIKSCAASIIPSKFFQNKNPELLITADKLIKETDLIVFGGAPMFNFYRNHALRAIQILKMAQKYEKPVLFSSIGVEGYDKQNKRCQKLKKALNFECVKQITTRDDFVSLQKFRIDERITIQKVSDPAVFSAEIFSKYKTVHRKNEKKKIGIFVLRHQGFVNNNVSFSQKDAASLWLGLAEKLEEKGYAYEFITSGHCGDEAFLDDLSRRYDAKFKNCVFNMDSPEKLIAKISSYDAVVSCRLHPSIIAFSLGVPSVGIVWKQKVTGFYSSIGYEDRALNTNDIHPAMLLDKLEQAMAEGVDQKEDFLMSVYRSLFYGIKNALGEAGSSQPEPYSYAELKKKLPAYHPVSAREQEERYIRKFRRIYKMYNKRLQELEQ